MGSADEGDHLVDCQLLAAQRRGEPSRFGSEEPPACRRQFELGAIVTALNIKRAGVFLDVVHGESARPERAVTAAIR